MTNKEPNYGLADTFMGVFGLTRCRCDNCKKSIPCSAYPKVYCLMRAEYVSCNDHCVRWEKKDD